MDASQDCCRLFIKLHLPFTATEENGAAGAEGAGADTRGAEQAEVFHRAGARTGAGARRIPVQLLEDAGLRAVRRHHQLPLPGRRWPMRGHAVLCLCHPSLRLRQDQRLLLAVQGQARLSTRSLRRPCIRIGAPG